MRLSELFTQTLREAPADVERPGLALLIRAGYVQPVSSGVYAALPLAEKALERLEGLARQCFGLNPGQKVDLPNAAALTAVVSGHIHSYKQLPAGLYTVQTERQEVERPRGGWLNSRWDRMFSVYRLTADEDRLAQAEERTAAGLGSFFEHCGLSARRAEGDPGLEADEAGEWHLALEGGSSTLLTCPACGYAAAEEAARFTRLVPTPEAALPLEKVATPHCPTIESLAQFLSIPTARTAKAVFLTAELAPGPNNEPRRELVFAVVRGDRDVNEAALRRLVGARALRPATDEEITSVGAVPGYASPLGVKGARVIVDAEVTVMPNLVSGANEAGYHLLNVNYGRDYTGETADIAAARPGDACPCCGQPLEAVESVRLARIERRTTLDGCTYRDESGQAQPVGLAKLELNLHRVLAAVAETRHDERGLRLPSGAAPYPVHMVLMPGKSGPEPEDLAARLYEQFRSAGLEPLLDDRSESAGVRFNDADLIGLPVRITVSERALKQGGVEFKPRDGGEAFIVPAEEALERARELL